MTGSPTIMIGLPYSSMGTLGRAAMAAGVPVLISAGSLWRDGALRQPAMAAWSLPAALDSAGFTAMRQGGYRWTVDEYVEMVVRSGAVDKGGAGDCLPFPWLWWSQMDYCCEPEIASDRSTVRARIALTSTSLGETLDCLDDWRLEGDSTTPDPLPILQGWQPDDYERSLELMVDVLASRGRAVPDLIGIGSVCRRPVGGPSGVISVLSRLDRVLPPHVRLHLFGVKGAALRSMGALAGRVRSVDSMAWDFGARMARAGGTSSVEHRAQAMRSWLDAQVHESPQLSLF